MQHLDPTATPAAQPTTDTSCGRGRREVPRRRRRLITGLRFHKSAINTGTHVGHLWSRTGQLLATATFTNETATGWQEVAFATPVAIAANTTYVASYHAPNGHYSVNERHFAAAGVDSPPLHALRDGVDGGNGVYGYGAERTFPTGTFQSRELLGRRRLRDRHGPDTKPPTVTGDAARRAAPKASRRRRTSP